MQRLNVGFWYYLAQVLSEASRVDLATASAGDIWPLFQATQALNELEQSTIVEITTSRAACQELRAALEEAQQQIFHQESPDTSDDPQAAKAKRMWQGHKISTALDKLDKVLQEELKIADVYAVGQKRIYSRRLLIEKADESLGAEDRKVVPEAARKDFREAGRCLAFELPTAAGYHAMRATERTLREWYSEATGKPAGRIKWSTAIEKLRSAGADEATLAALDRVRALHRNPLAHPEIFLGLHEALEVFGAAETAINAVARQLAIARAAKAAGRRHADRGVHPAQGGSVRSGRMRRTYRPERPRCLPTRC